LICPSVTDCRSAMSSSTEHKPKSKWRSFVCRL
jgi:hypothetical protein